MATLPAQIQRDLDRANAFLNPPQEPVVQSPTQPVQEPPTQRVVEQTQQPAHQPQVHEPDEQTWQQRYRSLQGVIASQAREHKQQMAQMEQRFQQLLDAQPKPETPRAPINPQDAETFGEDLVEMVRRTAESMSGNTTKALNERIAQLEQQLAGASAVASKTADEVFYERLTQMVPDWDEVNKNEGFLAWLAEIDPMYGTPRQTALTQAGNARDVDRVAHIFRTWIGSTPQTPKPAARQEPQVSPHTSGNGAAQVVQDAQSKGYITIQQVEAFYKDVQKGLYRGRDEIMAQQEAVINAALAENRIIDARQIPRQM